MCLLVAYLPGALPDPAALSRAASRNPDGYGWAIVAHGRIISHRTMDASDGVDSFVAARAANPDGPALWHARIGTHGGRTLENCHPFTVADNPLVVVGHNGMLPISTRCGRSDTRVFASEMVRVSDLDSPGAMYWLERWAEGSKLVFLSADPSTVHPLYIVNESDGHWLESEPGVWYSNDSHEERVPLWSSSDPRKSAGSTSSGGDPIEVGRSDLGPSDPWAFYRDGDPVLSCGECGQVWPGFCEWCDDCGTMLDESAVVVFPDDLDDLDESDDLEQSNRRRRWWSL